MSFDICKEYREYKILHQTSYCVVKLLRDKVVVAEAYSE